MINNEFDKLLKELIKDYKLNEFEDKIFKISKPTIVILANEEDKFEKLEIQDLDINMMFIQS